MVKLNKIYTRTGDDGTTGLNPQGNPLSAEGCNPLINDLTGKNWPNSRANNRCTPNNRDIGPIFYIGPIFWVVK